MTTNDLSLGLTLDTFNQISQSRHLAQNPVLQGSAIASLDQFLSNDTSPLASALPQGGPLSTGSSDNNSGGTQSSSSSAPSGASSGSTIDVYA